ncbi:hypothetical protein [Dyadobacter frigoris]|uniref:hypothetical protein n=1 Tax=Dyadobacter frigoris TaxID=2576211 RepID=UPI0025545059|nr:hypothetical protein [Dyadobacter frigoris]
MSEQLSEKNLQLMIVDAPVGIIIIDGTGKIIWCNVRGKALLLPFFGSDDFKDKNLYPILDLIGPDIKT